MVIMIMNWNVTRYIIRVAWYVHTYTSYTCNIQILGGPPLATLSISDGGSTPEFLIFNNRCIWARFVSVGWLGKIKWFYLLCILIKLLGAWIDDMAKTLLGFHSFYYMYVKLYCQYTMLEMGILKSLHLLQKLHFKFQPIDWLKTQLNNCSILKYVI